MHVRACCLVAICLMGVSRDLSAASSPEYRLGDLQIGQPYIAPTPPGAPVAGAYLVIRNDGAGEDRLLGGSADFCKSLILHEMDMTGGMMSMRAIKDGVSIPAGGTVQLGPDGLHFMCNDPSGPIVKGQTYPATLVFEKAGSLAIEFSTVLSGQGTMRRAHH